MKVAVTGASGLIGSALVPALKSRGHDVVRLVRRAPAAPDEVRWDPASGQVDLAGLAGTEGIVHLAGAGVGDKRWTEEYKREIRSSRVDGTRTIAEAAAALDPLPRVFVCGSAIGYYGDTGDRAVTETAPAGPGFLAGVVVDWEAAAQPARDAGIRVPLARTGLVVSSQGGAWKRLLPIFKLGLGGKVGSGKQYWSFISLEDEVAALIALLEDDAYEGPVNLTAPTPRDQRRGHRRHGPRARSAHRAPGARLRPQGGARGVLRGRARKSARTACGVGGARVHLA